MAIRNTLFACAFNSIARFLLQGMNSVQFCKFPLGFPVEQVVFAGFLLLVDAPFLSF
jgi:hypothetical protein